jgi:hypothetical protein
MIVALNFFFALEDVELEVLTAMVMASSIFFDIVWCSPLKFSQRFGGRSRLHRKR